MTTLPPLIDEEKLRRYLAEQLPGEDLPLIIERVRGGHSNETFYITRGDQQWVLRRPPRGPLLPTAHDVLREYRVLKALNNSAVPTPRVLLACEDTSVIGAPFYLMERVHGYIIRDTLPPYGADEAGRKAISRALIDALVELHAVDWQAVGLGDFGRPTGYLERQLRRWIGQLERSRQRPLPELDMVTEWLKAHLPVSGPSTIVHGDYRLDNVMYAEDGPRVVAIFDWEMATIGDPLADLGYLLSFWREPGDPPPALDTETWRVMEQPGFLTRAELKEYYAERSGRSVREMDFYEALAIWKLAILLEGSYARYRAGTTDDPFFEQLETGIPALARRALEVCQRSASGGH
uniref:Acyl-CoA dehydrogenase n=1 Tax=Thermogemmatispora argillosa TaxID=2045280 RepID=A0A455T7D9_9CHLR|nr:acyl-CoA dehydrogenase [Thermogemmatispora argillosa]